MNGFGVASRAPGARGSGTHAAGPAPGCAKDMGGCDISAVGRPFLRYNGMVGRREGREWHRAGRRASRRPGGRAGPGARGGPSSPARRAPSCPGRTCWPWAGRRGRAWQAALARRDAARDAPRAVLAGPAGRRLRGACHDSLLVRDLVGCRYRVPDATTMEAPGQERVELARLSWTQTGPEGGVVKLQIKASSDYKNEAVLTLF